MNNEATHSVESFFAITEETIAELRKISHLTEIAQNFVSRLASEHGRWRQHTINCSVDTYALRSTLSGGPAMVKTSTDLIFALANRIKSNAAAAECAAKCGVSYAYALEAWGVLDAKGASHFVFA